MRSAASTRWRSQPGTASTRSAVIAAFLHAARLGIFEMSWNVLCPGCGGVLDAGATLKTVQPRRIQLRALRRRLRADARRDGRGDLHGQPAGAPDRGARSRHSLPMWEYCRQIFWGSGVDLPDDLRGDRSRRSRSRRSSCRPARRRCSSLQLPAEVRDRLRPGDACGAVHRRQGRADPRAPEPVAGLRPGARAQPRPSRCGPGRCGCRSRTAPTRRVLPGVWVAGDALHDLLGQRRPFLTAKRLLTNQTFRDIYRTDTLDVDQRLKITSLTFLFTDLQRLDRALRAGRRPRRLRPGAGAFPGAATRSSRPRPAPWSRPSAMR